MAKPDLIPNLSTLHGGSMTDQQSDTSHLAMNGISASRKQLGRPKTYDEDKAVAICSDLMDGMSLFQSLKKHQIGNIVFARWLSYDVFKEIYLAARVMSAELMASEIMQIADDFSSDSYIDPATGKRCADPTAVNRARLRVSARQWYLSKVLPKVYGDKVALTDADGDSLRVDISWLKSRSIGKPEDLESRTIEG